MAAISFPKEVQITSQKELGEIATSILTTIFMETWGNPKYCLPANYKGSIPEGQLKLIEIREKEIRRLHKKIANRHKKFSPEKDMAITNRFKLTQNLLWLVKEGLDSFVNNLHPQFLCYTRLAKEKVQKVAGELV